MLLMTLIMLVSFGITSVIVRQARFSRIVKDSFIAYNAADMAVMCASFIDNNFSNSGTGYGIFPTDPVAYPLATATTTDQSPAEVTATLALVNSGRNSRTLPSILLKDINCGGVAIFDDAVTGITYTPYTYYPSSGPSEAGKKSTFNLKIPLANGNFRCAKVIFNKSPHFGQIISSGYSTCEVNATSRLERVIVSSSESS